MQAKKTLCTAAFQIITSLMEPLVFVHFVDSFLSYITESVHNKRTV